MGKMEMGAQCMGNGMYQAQVGIGEPKACNDASQHHLFPGLHICSVHYGSCNIPVQDFQSFYGIVLRQRIGPI